MDTVHRGSYISAHVLLNLLNELGKKIRCKALPSNLSVFPKSLYKFNNTGARMQDSNYHMTLKSHFISKFSIKPSFYILHLSDEGVGACGGGTHQAKS